MKNTLTYQEILEEQLRTITSELSAIAVLDDKSQDWTIKTTDLDHTEADINNQADAAEEADERVAIMAELENRYNAITRALQKIKAGTYGICEISGEPIEVARLEANPAARTCILHMETEYKLPLP